MERDGEGQGHLGRHWPEVMGAAHRVLKKLHGGSDGQVLSKAAGELTDDGKKTPGMDQTAKQESYLHPLVARYIKMRVNTLSFFERMFMQ